MSIRERFTPEEWSTLLRAPAMAALALVAASPSGPLGLARELVAVERVLAETRRSGNGTALVGAVAAELGADRNARPVAGGAEGMGAEALRRHALGVLRDAVGILYRKGDDEEIEGFKRWLYRICEEVARAAREGGFLGIGGTLVSDEEAATLRQAAWALGLPIAGPPAPSGPHD